MRAFDSIANYDFGTWMLGIFRSFVSGGAAALITSGGGAIAGITARQQYIMMASSFMGLGLYRMGEFLQLHGAPDQLANTLDKAADASKQAAVQANKAADAVAVAKSQVTETK